MAVLDKDLKEIADGSAALCDWFASQETSSTIAGAIMANVIAALMVTITTDADELTDLYEQFGKLLLGIIKTKISKEKKQRNRGLRNN